MQYLFIYDELRTTAGHPLHNYLRSHCDYLGPAQVGGWLVDVDGRPGLLPAGGKGEQVAGELYRIHEGADEQLFGVLDPYQGCSADVTDPGDFFRHSLPVTLQADTQTYDAWVYVYHG